jgi:polygalacturonase
VETIDVPAGKTLYVAGGAVIYGHYTPGKSKEGAIVFLHGDKSSVRGRGIIDGSLCPWHQRGILDVRGSNILLEGVVLRDSSGWTVPLHGCDHVQIRNLKVFGWRGNSDGIDICESRDVDVNGCYLRTWDDLVVIKTQIPALGESNDITVKKCVLWNELAHALSIGAELRKGVHHILFTDCDVIHDKGREWLLRIYHCDSGEIKDVVFDNIRIEESQRAFSLWIGKELWSQDVERGHIDNVLFRNIHLTGDPRVELKGFDVDHAIHGVRFENVLMNGKSLKMENIRKNESVDGVSVIP